MEEEVVVIKEKKKGFFGRLLDKTIIPDMIAQKKADKAFERQMKKEAKKDAMEELKPELVKHYKQQELDKLTGKKKTDALQKFADGFSGSDIGSTEKLNQMLGNDRGAGTQHPDYEYVKVPVKNKKTKTVKRKVKKQQKKNPFDMDEKIKRMLE